MAPTAGWRMHARSAHKIMQNNSLKRMFLLPDLLPLKGRQRNLRPREYGERLD